MDIVGSSGENNLGCIFDRCGEKQRLLEEVRQVGRNVGII